MLELRANLVRVKQILRACYSWCLTASRRSWWSGGSWWALEVCGSPKKRRLSTVCTSPFWRWRRSILSEDLLLSGAREQNLCVSAPTWIRGSVNSSIPQEKIRLSRVLHIYIQALNFLYCDLALLCLFVWLGQWHDSLISWLELVLAKCGSS